MLHRAFIILAYLAGVLGASYLFRTVGAKWKGRNTPAKPDTPPAQQVENESGAPEVGDNPLPIRPAPPPPVEVRETPIPGSELRYYQPFGPADSILDVWYKLQTFTSTEPITVRLIPSDNTTPIVTGSFLPDGAVHSTREMFFLELANSIRSNGGPGAWRAVRKLSSFGIPASAREGAYHIFTGTLRMELKGVRIMGLTFSVEVTFEPNLGLIPGHFSNLNEYFHCEMLSAGLPGRGRVEPENVVVGFPWSLIGVTLYSQDPSLHLDGSKITKAIIGKYEKYVRQRQAIVPTPEDATRKVTLASDGIVVIAIHEGLTRGRRFLRIEYGPSPKGPIDKISAGDDEFVGFAKSIEETRQPCLVAEAEAALNTPF